MRANEYLSQIVNYGGEWVTVGWLYIELGDRIAGSIGNGENYRFPADCASVRCSSTRTTNAPRNYRQR